MNILGIRYPRTNGITSTMPAWAQGSGDACRARLHKPGVHSRQRSTDGCPAALPILRTCTPDPRSVRNRLPAPSVVNCAWARDTDRCSRGMSHVGRRPTCMGWGV